MSVLIVDAQGFDAQQFKIAGELRLRRNGIPIKPKGLPVVEVNLHSLKTNSNFLVCTLAVALNDSVTYSNGEKGVAVVWRDFMTLYLDTETADVDAKINKSIAELLDGLSNDYLAANPPAREVAN